MNKDRHDGGVRACGASTPPYAPEYAPQPCGGGRACGASTPPYEDRVADGNGNAREHGVARVGDGNGNAREHGMGRVADGNGNAREHGVDRVGDGNGNDCGHGVGPEPVGRCRSAQRAPRRPAWPATVLAFALAVAGCGNLAPRYEVPAVDVPVAFKEGQGTWVRAAPADAMQRGPWWELFGDPELDRLAALVEVNNQNVAAAAAAYAQARALTQEQRSTLFPRVDLDASGSRSGGASVPTRSSYQVNIGAAWEPDVWGRLRLGVQGARAGEQASQADLAAATLAAQGELAASYFGVREADLLRASLTDTVRGYERSLEIARNRYEVGVAARTDLLQAETQLANARADLVALERQRAQFEHAVAVLVGKAPAHFSLPPDPQWRPRVPDMPLDVPSTLLQRRPDIAAAERRVEQANTRIGIERAGFFPSINLTGRAGLGAASLGDLFSASALVWSVGAALAQTIFDAGATRARVAGARAALEEASARYRQVVLGAFQDVEDQLVALRVLQQQQSLRQRAWEAAEQVEQQVMNRYRSGLVGYTEVVTAQNSAAAARRALVQVQADRLLAAVALVQALGGGWRGL